MKLIKNKELEGEFNKFEANTLSVIIRSHKEERIPLLDETLFSLAIQNWKDVEVIIVLQNGTEEFKNKVWHLIEKHPFQTKTKFQVQIVKIEKNTDGRSYLLNFGIGCAKGRYIAFLDDDDFVYQHCYSTLISQLKTSNCPIAVGGCRTASIIKTNSEKSYIEKKENPFSWGKGKFDLIENNFIPIHSYVIDRTLVDESDLFFDTSLSLLEDYDFLLRLAAKYEFDFTKLDTPVCEYRLHSDNSLPFAEAVSEMHAKAIQHIENRKKSLKFQLPIEQLKSLIECQIYAGKMRQEITQMEIVHSKLSDNPQVIRKFLNNMGDNFYDFFSTRPKLEKRISRIVHLFLNPSN